MGSEVACSLKFGEKVSKGTALLETKELIFRGKPRLSIKLSEIKSLSSRDGKLKIDFPGGTAIFTLGTQADKWAEKIRNPKSLLEKLGVKPDSTVSVFGVDDKIFLRDLNARTRKVSQSVAQKGSNLIFFGADSAKDLIKLSGLKKFLTSDGALWIVSLKGKLATIKDIEVMAAGKKVGLVDTKVVGFSETHTALKFVIPVAGRGKR